MARVFKARMILYAAYGHCIIREDGSYYEHPRWFELAKEKKQEPSTDIEAQLEAARERLRRFNEMEMEEKK